MLRIRLPVHAVFSALLALALAQLGCAAGAAPASTGAPAAPTLEAAPTQAPSGTASERGTPDEAKAMLQKAVDHYNAVGRDQALADFTAGVAPFIDRDLYVVCMGRDHLETANGGFPEYVGVSGDALTDIHGNPLGKTVWEAASTSAVNSVDYHWVNPVSGQTEPKTLYFEEVGTDVCGVGAYNP
jgi:cytochrome c